MNVHLKLCILLLHGFNSYSRWWTACMLKLMDTSPQSLSVSLNCLKWKEVCEFSFRVDYMAPSLIINTHHSEAVKSVMSTMESVALLCRQSFMLISNGNFSRWGFKVRFKGFHYLLCFLRLWGGHAITRLNMTVLKHTVINDTVTTFLFEIIQWIRLKIILVDAQPTSPPEPPCLLKALVTCV